MSSPQWSPDESGLDALQPDGNFDDEPPTEEELELQRRLQELDTARAANRQGPSHPAHDFHGQWLAERGLGPEWDNPTGR
jgi:hypothetical protein